MSDRTSQPVEIRLLGRGDEAVLANAAPDVFDDPVDTRAAREFLADPRHHIAVALAAGTVIGFASAVHYVHPDAAQPELWINEVGVAGPYRRRGIGGALVRALLARAREAGCAEAWVLTERSNREAMHLYASLGGVESPEEAVLFEFRLDGPAAK
jgi:aminoglycoside 6'-N-acetyltransferase I